MAFGDQLRSGAARPSRPLPGSAWRRVEGPAPAAPRGAGRIFHGWRGVRLAGIEHLTLVLQDPSNNLIEFK